MVTQQNDYHTLQRSRGCSKNLRIVYKADLASNKHGIFSAPVMMYDFFAFPAKKSIFFFLCEATKTWASLAQQ